MSCMYSEKGLDLDTAIGILENVEEYTTISQPPVKPKGGEIFVFLPDTINEQENYKCDQYRWLNSGPKEIPRKNPLVKKQYFIGKLPQGKTQAFQKHCYVLVGDHRSPYPVLLHYIGDETVMVDYPHGNAKKNNTAYFAIAPSVRKDIASRSQNCLPTAIINSYKSSPSSYTINEEGEKGINPVLTPRNKSQVRNIRRKQKLSTIKDGIPKDDLATLHSLGSELLGFCHYIRTQPELACIVGLNELSTEVENLMKLNNNVVVFSFHETYKIGRYFVTPFNCIHTAFADQPAIPCYFLVSEVCDFFVFEKFLQTIIECIPCLEECHTAVITNQDYSFTSSLTVAFPNWLQVYDWEILFVAARSFLRKLHVDIKDISLRIKQLKQLMSVETIEDYKMELDRLKKDWPLAFCEYYIQVLSEPVENRLGRWQLERYKLYSQQMGLHRGVNQELQVVIKNLQELKDVSLDVILPSLYHLQVYVYACILKGFCGIGKYTLSSHFKFLQRDIDELMLPPKIYEPSGIVKIFRVRGITMFSENPEFSDDENTSLLQAQRIVEMGNISHSTGLKAFLVKSTSGSLHGVQLFPRESCSCSINQRCAHIMSVMMALGMPVTYDKKGAIKVIRPSIGELLVTMDSQDHTHKPDEFEVRSNFDTSSTADATNHQQIGDDGENLLISENSDQALNQVTATPSQVTAKIGKSQENNEEVAYSSVDNVYQHGSNIVQVNSADLESVLSATGSEVLMVVSDGTDGDQKSLLTYEVAQEAMLAYAQAQSQQGMNEDPNVTNVQIVGVPQNIELGLQQGAIQGSMAGDATTTESLQQAIQGAIDAIQAESQEQNQSNQLHENKLDVEPQKKRSRLVEDITPEQLILSLSDTEQRT